MSLCRDLDSNPVVVNEKCSFSLGHPRSILLSSKLKSITVRLVAEKTTAVKISHFATSYKFIHKSVLEFLTTITSFRL